MMMQETQDHAAQNPEPVVAEKPPSPEPHKHAALAKRSKPESAPKPRKRQKTRTPPSEDENDSDPSVASGDESDEITKPKQRSKEPLKKTPARKPKTTAQEESEASDVARDINAHQKATNTKDDSDSEMSVVFDEEPKPKAPPQRTTECRWSFQSEESAEERTEKSLQGQG